MNVERTVTVNLPKNIDDFLAAYAKSHKYKSVEDLLEKQMQWHAWTLLNP